MLAEISGVAAQQPPYRVTAEEIRELLCAISPSNDPQRIAALVAASAVETRAVGVALAFSISLMIFGGFAPFVATWLIAQTGDPLSPSSYLMATALLSIVALMAIGQRSAAYHKSDEVVRSVV